MQTLTVGSFLNLENLETVEALKFTARRLAEMTTAVIAENLPPAALENLANDLWQRAEYVARETERRKLREIFVENFGERFRELKPEVTSAEITNLEVQSNISTVGSIDSAQKEQSAATVDSTSTPDSPKESATEAQEKKDEFLGFVKADEPLVASPATKINAATTTKMPTEPEKIERETTQSAPEDDPAAGEKVSTENPNEIKPPTAVAPVANAKDNPPPASAVKTSVTAAKTAEAVKEPFEFGKCTVNLSLVLLPSSGNEQSRKAIVSATSHNSPPEIEFLEINEGEDLTEIAALVRGRLERFKQTLPAKYIEQLRQSKTKSSKKPGGVKPAVAVTSPAPTKSEIVQPKAEETNDSQPAQNERATESEKDRIENVATKENEATQAAPVAVIPHPVATATSNVQPSLF